MEQQWRASFLEDSLAHTHTQSGLQSLAFLQELGLGLTVRDWQPALATNSITGKEGP